MNKKIAIALLSFILIGVFDLNAQRRGGASDEEIKSTVKSTYFDIYAGVYENSIKINDLGTAINAVQTMLAVKPEETHLKDTLALLYFNTGMYYQAMIVSDEILQKDAKKVEMLEVRAISKQSLGQIREALSDYETLYRETSDVYYKYQVATLQYSLGRFGEATSNIDKLLSREEIADRKLNITATQNQVQEVPMRAALLNMLGVIALEVNQPESALNNFKQALELHPSFILASNNLKMVEEYLKENK
ncbi:MAG: hypothetical protein EA412_03255 [Chitinophagaceae bacterium]|nr:MAG: hypothetical protein EA412_03255 [Chitinophagaceae bacterium]